MRLQNSHDRLSNGQKLIISPDNSAQDIRLKLGLRILPSLKSNQEEADTRMFLIVVTLNYDSYLFRSTDSDVLFVAYLIADALISKNIMIHYNVVNSSPKYVVHQ